MDTFLTSFGLMLMCGLCTAQKLSPTGKNVCLNTRNSPTCCSGWGQHGDECTVPLCEGDRACLQDEVCVYPGLCRCKAGFYGYQCKTRCPPEFWGPDCHELCPCHPGGVCDPATGKCSCLPSHWGNLCQNSCKCGRHGKCDPVYGNCTCEEGWWTSTCSKACQCYPGTSTCDQATGRCFCNKGFWGQKCSLRCSCYLSPCQQHTGACQCLHGWWGPSCDRRCNCNLSHAECDPLTGVCLCHPGYKWPLCHEPCSSGNYGSGCKKRCGHCQSGRPCSIQDGLCDACAPGWNGTHCDQRCQEGFYGHHCQEVCPRCRNKDPCDLETGACLHCDPGWTGPRCDKPCTDGTYGDGCRFLCKTCYHGHCDHVTGSCICLPGFQGESCNSSCPVQLYGVNCSSICDCGNHACHPTTGACPNSSRAGLLVGLLIPLLILILALLFCCCCCGGPVEGKEGVAVVDGSPVVRMKHHVYTVLANMGSAMPCITLWSSGLPRVTVSHHDPELTFNHSFIEQPSSGWVTDSFETDDEGEAIYCEPPREDVLTVAGGELQELNSKCNFFLDPSNFSSEDMSQAFGIPRTSSIAKSKRPSVSFAEGTKFSPKERRCSIQDLPGSTRKPKAWGMLMLSALQGGQGNHSEVESKNEEKNEVENASSENQGATTSTPQASDSEKYSSGSKRTHLTVPVGRRRTLSNTRKNAQLQSSSDGDQDTDSNAKKLTTVYVTVGKTPNIVKQESSSEGPVQAMLRRLGSLQRQEATQPKGRGQVIVKPPRRKLGARASVWEQAAGSGHAEVVMRKPSRRKHNSLSSPCTVGPTDFSLDNSTLKRPLSSILMSVPESEVHRSLVEQDAETISQPGCPTEHAYETVAPSEGISTSSEIIINETVVEQVENEANYENVYVKDVYVHS
ncbi:scavenger receptor class F member 1-like isoform X2 [Myxocyprinus asiaticus]|uniref:scavenger receptor class F member 1-like isoform X2 n=1 Tax=Myxocyprinus asiaticus TaxID=70543 RepID=UPI00222291D5|nr:scavenger receptor class F member 1-like isoform X2 [Myxocyprinus asiaticus]